MVNRRREPPKTGKGSRRSKVFGKSDWPAARATKKWREENIAIAYHMVKEGASDIEVAEVLGVNPRTMRKWKALIPEFAKAFLRGVADRVKAVEESMFKRAMGMTLPDEKIFQYQGKVVRAKTETIYPPDPAAAKLFLQGNAPEKYGDKLELAGNQNRPVAFIIEGLNPVSPAKKAPKPKADAPNEQPDTGQPAGT